MERLGLQRAAHFSWQKSARATLRVYEEVVAEGMIGKGMAVPAALAESPRKR